MSFMGLLRNMRRLGAAATWAGLLGLGVLWLRHGRHAPPPEDQAVEEAGLVGEHGGNGQHAGNGHPGPDGEVVEEPPGVVGDVTTEGEESFS